MKKKNLFGDSKFEHLNKITRNEAERIRGGQQDNSNNNNESILRPPPPPPPPPPTFNTGPGQNLITYAIYKF